MNTTSTSSDEASHPVGSHEPSDADRPYEPAHGAPHIPIEVPDSAWGKLGRFGFRRRWVVLGAWVVALVTVFALVGATGPLAPAQPGIGLCMPVVGEGYCRP